MPYKSSSIPLSESQDRRRKLTSEQKEHIIRLYSTGMYTLTKLGKQFGVSRSLISIIVNPERAKAVKQRTKEHWRDYRPTKEKWAETMREYRHRKQKLYINGELGKERSE